MAARELGCPGRFHPRVLLLDLGFAVLGQARLREPCAEEGFRDLVIVAIWATGGQEEDRQARSPEVGINHHVTKPVDVKTISELISLVQVNDSPGNPLRASNPTSRPDRAGWSAFQPPDLRVEPTRSRRWLSWPRPGRS